jgi:hypothetical protein
MDTATAVSDVRFGHTKNGHCIVSITALDPPLTGEQELQYLETKEGYRVSSCAKSCVTNGSYNLRHRLAPGREYRAVFISGSEIHDDLRTTVDMHGIAGAYGYEKPFAGHMLRIPKAVSANLLEEMDVARIICLHEPLKNSNNDPHVLSIGDRRWFDADLDKGGDQPWSRRTAFLYIVPEIKR